MASVLLTFAGGRGHLLPMLPLAHALRGAGHALAVSGRASALDDLPVFDQRFPHAPATPSGTGPGDGGTGTLTVASLEDELDAIGRAFAGTIARRNAEHTASVLAREHFDLVVCDEIDFGSIAAAQAAGHPVVVVSVIASGALVRAEHAGEPLRALRVQHGLDPDDAFGRRFGDLAVVPFPASFRDPAYPLPATAVLVRPAEPPAEASHPAAEWFAEGDEPRVYVTLGTIFNTDSGDLFARILTALADLPLRVLATVGPDVDPSSIGVSGPRLRIERYVPQGQVLAHADAVVNHGGSGSVMGALARGLPVVVLPLGADQSLNGTRVTDLGLGAVLDPLTETRDQLRDAVLALLRPEARRGAQAMAAEIAGLPPVEQALPAVEALLG